MVVAVFALSAGWSVRRSLGTRRALWVPIIAGAPAAAILVAQTLANKLITGDATAAGALVKLELHHPHLSAIEAYNAWKFHVEYQVRRVAEYHLSGTFAVGYVPFALGALALAFRETRRWALLLWASAICWVLMVALNGQVRWQNERYTMPALHVGAPRGVSRRGRGLGQRRSPSDGAGWCCALYSLPWCRLGSGRVRVAAPAQVPGSGLVLRPRLAQHPRSAHPHWTPVARHAARPSSARALGGRRRHSLRSGLTRPRHHRAGRDARTAFRPRHARRGSAPPWS